MNCNKLKLTLDFGFCGNTLMLLQQEHKGPFSKRFIVSLFVFLEIRVNKKVCENTCNTV